MRVAYIGNFKPEHSTESHVATAWERQGHEVHRLQEDGDNTWPSLANVDLTVDLVLWTRTGWDWQAALGQSKAEVDAMQLQALARWRAQGIPSVGFHLDRWWGLDREGQVREEPFFRCDLVFTADGGHDREWAEAGVSHRWLPPGVSLAECERAYDPRDRRWPRHDVLWVGSWRSYHPEWVEWRKALVTALQRRYGPRRFGVYPRAGTSVRGKALTQLYGGAKVVVGDSCLAGGATAYWSDRIPESLGRGAFLLHPWVEGLDEHYQDGVHLACYEAGNVDDLLAKVEDYLHEDEGRERIREQGRAHVMAEHTYERRVEQIIETCQAEGLL